VPAESTAARATELHQRLRTIKSTVAVAESLTGGLLAAALTDTPGASATMRGGLVVYATDLKASLAGVSSELLARRGAVDPEVAAGLAIGARERLGASFGIGVTGVAGPDQQDGRTVGTVYVAVAGPVGEPVVHELQLAGDRASIRHAAVDACLDALAAALTELESAPGRESGS
jgi:nicotinamide-nucleotide amidase